MGLKKMCHHNGLQYPHDSEWEEECNTCQCVNGNVHCSKVCDMWLKGCGIHERSYFWTHEPTRLQVRCGRRPCLLPKSLSAAETNAQACPGGHDCIQHQFLTCFSPPCRQWGVCSTPDPPTALHTQCEPNSGYLDNSCAHITLIFKKDRVPQVNVFSLCLRTFSVF